MIDLHSHTTYSDGSYSVKELLEEAEKKGLSILSITDHNTIDAYKEIKDNNIRKIFNGKIIKGIEITTTYKGETIEVLGYGFDLDKMQKLLDENILNSYDNYVKEYELIKNQYKKIGIIFDENNIKFDPKVESSQLSFLLEIRKYPKNYNFCLNKGSFDSHISFARNELFNPKSPLYVDMSSLYPSLEKAIDIIHKSNGLAFLAHTYAYSSNIANELMNIISNYELDGLECFYSTFTKEQSDFLIKLCQERNMYISGGSDFHGNKRPDYKLGFWNNSLNVDADIIGNWIYKKTTL